MTNFHTDTVTISKFEYEQMQDEIHDWRVIYSNLSLGSRYRKHTDDGALDILAMIDRNYDVMQKHMRIKLAVHRAVLDNPNVDEYEVWCIQRKEEGLFVVPRNVWEGK